MRRLVLCCDGTWNSADSPRATNIEKISRCIETNSEKSGNEQVVEYIRGVGTSYRVDKWLGGWLGLGLTTSILDAYRWLVLNYSDGDEIFIFGFSRGAYMARSLGGMINKVGLLEKDSGFGPDLLSQARKIYSTPDNAAQAKEFRERHSYPVGPGIHFLGVFDTVGALGLPAPMNLWNTTFNDVKFNSRVVNGRHALAIDERRRAFTPTLWKPADDQAAISPKSVRQVWFRGAHSDVGGGYPETGLSDITLKWMIDEAEDCGLVFDQKKVLAELSGPTHLDFTAHQSMKLIYRLTNPIYGSGAKEQFRRGRRLLQLAEGTPALDLYANAMVSQSALTDVPEPIGPESKNVQWFRSQLGRTWANAVERWAP